MSLFKVRDWWSTTIGEEEEFDQGCLCLANIDNNPSGQDKVIIGSYHGILRIFCPRPLKSESGWSGYRPEDVMLESSLPNPVLQLEAGKFVSATENLHLAILHPRKLAVYNVSVTSGTVEHGTQYQLKLVYEHTLQRTAFSFCYGPFGGVSGKDFICVQSMDGTVSIFEQESYSFSRFLPGALLPGPIRYIPKLDSFVTVSSSWQVECYKYQVLAVASDTKTKEESQSNKTGKRVAFDWSFNIGEQALDIEVISSQAGGSIYVLGERNLYCLTDVGKLRFMKKFEYDPSCFVPYIVSENNVNYLVATHTKSIMVHQDVSLKWAAKLDSVPVCIRVGNFQDLKGVIVTLSDSGRLECSYLGTDPSLFMPPAIESRELNYAQMDAEMARLQKRVKEQSHKAVIMPNLKTEDDLQILIHVNPGLDDTSMAIGVQVEDPDPIPSITVRVQLKSRLLLENVRLTVHSKWPLAANQTSFCIPSVDPNKPSETFVAFFMQGSSLPSDLAAEVSASFLSASGAPRIATAKVKLPLKLVVKAVPPVKNAEHKLTLDTNKPPANLNEIFPELLGENAGGPGAALGFQFYGGPVITILASKSSQRYRLQCDRYEALWLLTQELYIRLASHFNRGKVGDFRASFTGQLPLQEYFDLVDGHFEFRLNAERCKEMLAQRASQFRVIQKRLLTRFKDKTPAPLANLDTLLEGTYRQILHLADAVEENTLAQADAANSLSSGTRLFNLVLKLWTGMSEEEYEVLGKCITPYVTDSQEQGWEESVDAAVTHLLRTTLAKSAKDHTLNPQPLTMPEDTTKVKKHIALLCDKLGKGSRLVDGLPASVTIPQSKPEKKSKVSSTRKTVLENGDADNAEDTETLIGSQFGESRGRKKREQELLSVNGPSKLSPLGPLEPARNRPDDEKRKQIESMVPDLDDMSYMEGPNIFENGEEQATFAL